MEAQVQQIYPVVFTNEEQKRVINCDNINNKKCYYCETVVKHITELREDVTQVRYIKNSKDNMNKDDIKYKKGQDKQFRFIEVKHGTVFNNKNKACIDYLYTKKYSNGTAIYRQPKGLDKAWFYCEYERIAFVFKDKVYFIYWSYLVNEIYKCIEDSKHKYNNKQEFLNDWYTTRKEFYIAPGLTGSIKDSNKNYDTFIINVDLDTFLSKHNIPVTAINYKVFNMSDVIQQVIFQ